MSGERSSRAARRSRASSTSASDSTRCRASRRGWPAGGQGAGRGQGEGVIVRACTGGEEGGVGGGNGGDSRQAKGAGHGLAAARERRTRRPLHGQLARSAAQREAEAARRGPTRVWLEGGGQEGDDQLQRRDAQHIQVHLLLRWRQQGGPAAAQQRPDLGAQARQAAGRRRRSAGLRCRRRTRRTAGCGRCGGCRGQPRCHAREEVCQGERVLLLHAYGHRGQLHLSFLQAHHAGGAALPQREAGGEGRARLRVHRRRHGGGEAGGGGRGLQRDGQRHPGARVVQLRRGRRETNSRPRGNTPCSADKSASDSPCKEGLSSVGAGREVESGNGACQERRQNSTRIPFTCRFYPSPAFHPLALAPHDFIPPPPHPPPPTPPPPASQTPTPLNPPLPACLQAAQLQVSSQVCGGARQARAQAGGTQVGHLSGGTHQRHTQPGQLSADLPQRACGRGARRGGRLNGAGSAEAGCCGEVHCCQRRVQGSVGGAGQPRQDAHKHRKQVRGSSVGCPALAPLPPRNTHTNTHTHTHVPGALARRRRS
jgi:hypothetical protein